MHGSPKNNALECTTTCHFRALKALIFSGDGAPSPDPATMGRRHPFSHPTPPTSNYFHMPMLILLDRGLTTHIPRSVESQDTAQNVSYSLTTFITNYLLLNFSPVQFKVGYKCKNLWSCISKTLSASGGGLCSLTS